MENTAPQPQDTIQEFRRQSDSRLAPVIVDGRHLRLDQYFRPIAYPKFGKSEIPVTLDVTKPVTIPRLKTLATRYKALTVCVSDWRFYSRENANEYTHDFLNQSDLIQLKPTVIKVDYRYNVQLNRLLIYRNNKIVYANDDGVICTNIGLLQQTYNPGAA